MGTAGLVKRATPRADELTTDEYQAGLAQASNCVRGYVRGGVFRWARWLASAANRTATPGWQESDLVAPPSA